MEGVPNGADINTMLKQAFDLVERGKREIRVCEEYESAILVLGGTGAGKSTFTQWIAGYNTNLTAKEIACGEFLIGGDDRISNSTINSQTIYPELVLDTIHNIAFYDCPGFGDTRSTSYDLATTYLIKMAADYASRVKLIFVVRYPSVRKGVDREDFMKLMKHVTDLVKDINKFRNSFALIVTKVDNITEKQGDSRVLVSDESIINAIADFLVEVREDLKENLKREVCPETKYYKNTIKIVDILLTKLRETFTRIGLFRRPEVAGLLHENASFENSKRNIQKIIFKTLDFANKAKDDFGYGLSEKSKNDINDIVEEINEKFWLSIRKITLHVEDHFRGLEGNVYTKIESFITSTSIVEADPAEAKELSLKFRNGAIIIEELVKRVKDQRNLEEIVLIIIDGTSHLSVVMPEETMSLMMNHGKYLHFIQTVCDRELNTRPWAEVFKDTLIYFKNSDKNLQDAIDKVVVKFKEQITSILGILTETMQEAYLRKMKILDIQSLLRELNKDKEILFDKTEKIKQLTSTKEIVETFCDDEHDFSINIPGKILQNISVIKNYLLYLENLNNKPINIGISLWLLTLQDITKFLQESENWYKFLYALYAKFSEYKVQKEKQIYNVANIEDWGKSGKPMGIEINNKNFHHFLNKIANFSITELSSVTKYESSDLKIKELNHVIELTLKCDVNAHCTETTLTIKGNFLSLKSIFNYGGNACVTTNINELLKSENLKTINLYASDTIFIDQDLILIGKKLAVVIIAPRWEVIGTRKIDISGDTPVSINSSYRGSGKQGESGKPGGPGGNFFGIGEHFINGENLSILVNGGTGGSGQKGLDGKDGQDATGEDVDLPVNPGDIVASALTAVLATPVHAVTNVVGSILNPFSFRPTFPTVTPPRSTVRIGKKGGKGENGGDGGRGGEGGNPGKVVIVELSNPSGVLKFSCKGKSGENGAGGKGGLSGLNAPGKAGVNTSDSIPSGRDSPAKNGEAGANCAELRNPDPAPTFNDFARVTNECTSYLKENVDDRFKNVYLSEFLNLIDTSGQMKMLIKQ